MSQQGDQVADWATDWDHHDADWVENPYPIWDELRDRCPVAHTDRYGGMNVPVTFGGVTFTPGDYVYADNNGIIVSKKSLV